MIASAVRVVLRGKPYLSPTANAEPLLAVQARQQRWKLADLALRILRLLAEGQPVSQIAYQWGLKVDQALIVRAMAERALP